MHEWALAEGVIATALRVAQEQGLVRLTRIEVSIGELQGIERDVFRQALRTVMPAGEPRLASTRIDLRVEPVVFECRCCRHRFGPQAAEGDPGEEALEAIHFLPELAHAFLRCPSCDSPDFEVGGGRGVRIESVEGE